jgi:hypothetical protein
VFHILGKLGSGKSVLSVFLFQSGFSQVSSIWPAYFAFTESSDGRSATAGWASLIHQILLEDPSLFSLIREQPGQPKRNNPGHKLKLWTATRLKQTFEQLLTAFRRPAVYIIDALDQCDETMEAFVASFELLGKAKRPAKLLVLSRQGSASSTLAAQFPRLTSLDLDAETEHETAISTAIELRVADLCRKWRSPHLRSVITEKLSKTANGMYLLPMMTVKSLKKVNATPNNIQRVLDTLPDDLVSAYRQTLDHIEEADRPLAASVLLWVLFAARPMSVLELSSIVGLDSSVKNSHGLRMNTSIDLLGSPGVFELVGPILKVTEIGDHSFVFLAHYSAREFLLNIGLATDTARTSRSRPPAWLVEAFGGSKQLASSTEELEGRANRTLANRCFQYYTLLVPPGRASENTRSTLWRFFGSQNRRPRPWSITQIPALDGINEEDNTDYNFRESPTP